MIRRVKEANVYEPINLEWYLQYIKNCGEKSHAIKLSTSSDSLLQKSCQVKNCKSYKITKICLICGKYLCDKRRFDNKIICKKCNKVE